MLSVYENFHETLKHARQGYHILQDLTGPEIEIFMKASKTENWFQTGFQQPKPSLQNTVLTSLAACKWKEGTPSGLLSHPSKIHIL